MKAPLVLLALALVPSLVTRSCWPMDEIRYLELIREMQERGDWLRLTLEGQTYTEKTPFLLWQVAVLGKLLGLDLAARVVSALHAVLLLFAVRSLTLSVTGDAAAARRAAEYVAVGIGTYFLGQSFLFDMPLAAYSLGAIAIAARSFARGAKAPMSAWLLVGLAVFMKGPVALLHTLPPIAVVAVHHAGPKALVPAWRWAAAAALVAAPIATWVAACAAADPLGFGHGLEAFLVQVTGRIAGGHGHDRGWWIYAVAMAVLAVPWPLATRPRIAGTGLPGKLALVALALVVGFGAMRTRAFQYVFPEALLLLPWVATCALPAGREHAWPIRVLAGGFLVAIAAVLAGLVETWFARHGGRNGPVLAADLAAASRWPLLTAVVPLALAAFARVDLRLRFALVLAAGGLAVFPTLDPMLQPERSLPVLREHLQKGGVVVQFLPLYDGNFHWYLGRSDILVAQDARDLDRLLAGRDALVFGFEKQVAVQLSDRKIEPLVKEAFFGRSFFVWRG